MGGKTANDLKKELLKSKFELGYDMTGGLNVKKQESAPTP